MMQPRAEIKKIRMSNQRQWLRYEI